MYILELKIIINTKRNNLKICQDVQRQFMAIVQQVQQQTAQHVEVATVVTILILLTLLILLIHHLQVAQEVVAVVVGNLEV